MPTDCENMHGRTGTIFANAQQAKPIYNYKHTKEKLYTAKAATWFDWHVGLRTFLNKTHPTVLRLNAGKTIPLQLNTNYILSQMYKQHNFGSYEKNQPDALISQIYFGKKKLYMFRTVPLSIIGVFRCTHSSGICHAGYSYSLRGGSA